MSAKILQYSNRSSKRHYISKTRNEYVGIESFACAEEMPAILCNQAVYCSPPAASGVLYAYRSVHMRSVFAPDDHIADEDPYIMGGGITNLAKFHEMDIRERTENQDEWKKYTEYGP